MSLLKPSAFAPTLLALALLAPLSLPLSAWARCADAPAELKATARQLEVSASSARWRALWTTLEGLDKGLKARSDTPATHIQCLRMLQLDAAFYLSDEPLEGPLWSARALGAALSLEVLEALHELKVSRGERATRHVKRRDLQARLAPKKAPQDKRWVTPKGQTELFVPALRRGVTLTFSPSSPLLWRELCGLSKGCERLPEWSVEVPAGRELTLTLPRGEYVVRWSGSCADDREPLTLSAEAFSLTPPTLACRSEVTLTDERSGEVWQAAVLQEGEARRFEREGYEPVEVKAPEGGGPLRVALTRCATPLRWSVTPAQAQVEAPASARWGVPVQVSATHPGYAHLERTVELKRPERCAEQAPHQLSLTLAREVKVRAYSDDGLKQPLSGLRVGGLIEPESGALRRPPGQYAVWLSAEGFKPFEGPLNVTSCQNPKRCAPLDLKLTLTREAPPPVSTDQHLKRVGVVVLSAGAVFLGVSLFESASYEERAYSESLDLQRQALSQGLTRAYGLLGIGASLYALGALWPALTSE